MKYYRAYLSNKQEFVLDEKDLAKLEASMNTGSFVQLKKAIINPSYLMMIVPIPQSEAMEKEIPDRKMDGYIDNKTGMYVVTGENTVTVAGLKNEFGEN